MSYEKILEPVFNQICRSQQKEFLDLTVDATKVVKLYNRVASKFGSTPPLVILNVAEVPPGEMFAQVVPAARTLAEDVGARVLVDSSINSLPGATQVRKLLCAYWRL